LNEPAEAQITAEQPAVQRGRTAWLGGVSQQWASISLSYRVVLPEALLDLVRRRQAEG
jgi:hypothetical protein